MTRTAQNVDLHTGDSRDLRIPIYDGPTNDSLQDLSGASATYAVREHPGGPVLLQKTSAVGGGIVIDTTARRATVSIASTDTAAWVIPEGLIYVDYFHELEVVIAAKVATTTEGRFRLRKSVAGAGA